MKIESGNAQNRSGDGQPQAGAGFGDGVEAREQLPFGLESRQDLRQHAAPAGPVPIQPLDPRLGDRRQPEDVLKSPVGVVDTSRRDVQGSIEIAARELAARCRRRLRPVKSRCSPTPRSG